LRLTLAKFEEYYTKNIAKAEIFWKILKWNHKVHQYCTIYTTRTAVLYRINKRHESIRILQQFKMNEWYLVTELKVYVNQHDFVSDIQTPSRSWFRLCFLHELLMSFTINYTAYRNAMPNWWDVQDSYDSETTGLCDLRMYVRVFQA
jgi:hypothetical protein